MISKTLILSVSLAAAASTAALAGAAEPAAEKPATAAAADAPATHDIPAALRRQGYEECTGTRIRRRPGEDCPNFTLKRSYTQQDLQRTGQINVGDALRLLDPIFR